MGRLVAVVGERKRELLGQLRADVFAAARHPADGGDQQLGGVIFGEVPVGPAFQATDGEVILGMAGEDEHPGPLAAGLELLDDLDGAASRHGDVEQHHLGIGLPGAVEGFRARRGLSHHHHVLEFEKAAQALTEKYVVVG